MSDPTLDNPDAGEEETIRAVDAALSAQLKGAPADPTTPQGFYTALAGSAPAAPDRFRRDLRSRLLDAYADPAALPGEAATRPAEDDEGLHWSPPPLQGTPRRAAVPPPKPTNTWWMPRRAVSLAVGLAGIALLAVLLANMAAVLQQRNVTPTTTPIPAPAANPPISAENLGPAHAVEAAGVQYFAWSPDGRQAATAYGNNVEIWDAATGRLLHRIEVTGTTALAWSPDGRTLAAGAGRNTLYLLNASNGTQIATMTAPWWGSAYVPNAYGVRVLAWSPDSSRLASISGTEDGGVSVWDVAEARQVYSLTMPAVLWNSHSTPIVPGTPFEGPAASMHDVSWSADSAYVATQYSRNSLAGHEIAFWNAATGQFLFKIPPEPTVTPSYAYVEKQPARAVSWQPGTSRAAVAVGRTTQVWDVSSGTQIISMPEPSPPPLPIPTAVPTTMPPDFTPYPTAPLPVPTDALGQPIYPPSPPPYVSPTPEPTYVHSAERYDEVTGVVWSPDGGTIATVDFDHVRLWDAATGKQKQRLTAATGVNKVAWIAGGAMLVTLEGQPQLSPFSDYKQHAVDATGTLRLWDATTGRQLRTLLEGQVSDFYPSPTGDAIAIRSGTSVVLWTDTGSVQPTLTPIPTATLPMLPVPGTEVATPAATPEPLCGTWTIVPGPDLAGAEADLRAVAAAPGSPDDVWAVGYVRESGLTHTLVSRWDGVQWTRVPSPNLGTGNNFLNGVAALAPNDVWAVGYYSATIDIQQGLALHWDGTTWAEVPLGDAAPEGSTLNAVSGSGPNDVWAVGNVGGKFSLALHWDGSRWTRTSAPSPGIESNNLLAVVSISPNEAWAAGYHRIRLEDRDGDSASPLALRWDGTLWKPVTIPLDASRATGLTAVEPNDVWAVGSMLGIYSGAATAHWNGTRWFQPLLPRPYGPSDAPRSAVFSGVSATAANDVWAVGTQYGPETRDPSGSELEQPLTYHWDGKQWAFVQAPIISGATARLQLVAAISTYDVWVVGNLTHPSLDADGRYDPGAPQPLILRYTGPGCGTPVPRTTPRAARPTPPPAPATCELAWRTVPNMAPGPLNGVVALSANEAWAVGNTSRGQGAPNRPARTLVERWDGTRWAQVPSPNAGPGDNILYAVDALSSDDIWAVGGYTSPYTPTPSAEYVSVPQTPLVLHWDGVEWSVVPLPLTVERAGLHDVEAIAPGDIWAVGYKSVGFRSVAFALHWDGSAWAEVPIPDLGDTVSILSGIAALAHDDMWAVGTYGAKPNPQLNPNYSHDFDDRTLALHWNGREWTHVPTPNIERLSNRLAGVATLTSDDVWAVGATWTGESGNQITLHWDGNEWATVPSPQGLAHNGTGLYAVAPLSPGDVWGVGGANGFPYALHWDGARWTNVPASDWYDGPFPNPLNAASVSPDGDIWAVGGWDQYGAVTMRYSRTGCETPMP